MPIRLATPADIPRIAELGAELHAESPVYSRLPYSPARVSEHVQRLIAATDACVWVYEDGGDLWGFCGCSLDVHWASIATVAHEHSLYVHPSKRGGLAAVRMIKTMREFAYLGGAQVLFAGTSTGVDPERTVALYQRLGFSPAVVGLELYFGDE